MRINLFFSGMVINIKIKVEFLIINQLKKIEIKEIKLDYIIFAIDVHLC